MDKQSAARMRTALDNLAIVLCRPKFPENIGAAARVAHNMGISRLHVVCNQTLDGEKIRRMATHNAAALIDNMQVHRRLGDSLAPFARVIGTTTRHGRQRRLVRNPREMAQLLVPQLTANKVALLFGPEDKGLSNDDLKYCQMTVTIPTAGFSSLNLAQAVAILCYELHFGLLESLACGPLHPEPKLAETREIEGMYQHLEKTLCRIGFLQPDKHDYWMRNIRQFLGRLELRAKEVRLIRGLCRQFLWHEEKGGKSDRLKCP
ncbi:MAG: RNA methyltransferase [Deltaproteobacteria bacterium]